MLVLLSDRSARPVRVGPAGLRLPQNIQYTGGSILRVLHDPVPPDDWQKMSVQAMAQTNGLLTTLGTALLGAVGLLISNKAADCSRPRHLWAAFLAIACGALSLFFGYTNHSNLLYMIEFKNINPYDPGYLYSSHAQFYTLLAGAFFAADFAVHYVSKES